MGQVYNTNTYPLLKLTGFVSSFRGAVQYPPSRSRPQSKHMKRILTTTPYYRPGYKGGGVITAISNLINHLGDEFAFYVVTRDRDLGDIAPYPDIKVGAWQTVGNAQVRYLGPDELTFFNWRKILNSIEYDLIYLNSFFGYEDIWLLLLRKLRQIPYKPLIIASRGALLPGNLSMKSYKKKPFISLARLVGLYSNVIWQASTEIELQSINAQFGADIRSQRSSITIAPELLYLPTYIHTEAEPKISGSARIIFISRIAPEKNLHFILNLLGKVTEPVYFDIYGTIDDEEYWKSCQEIIASLPKNVNTQYKGTLHFSQVNETFARYHLFILPAQGESFGYVTIESLFAGCPVLISDRTPWQDFQEKGVGWVVPLEQPAEFQRKLKEVIDMDQATFAAMSKAAHEYARNFVQNNNQLEASRQLFLNSINAVKSNSFGEKL